MVAGLSDSLLKRMMKVLTWVEKSYMLKNKIRTYVLCVSPGEVVEEVPHVQGAEVCKQVGDGLYIKGESNPSTAFFRGL